MRWLVRLVTPPSGLCLDPFTGSGSTGKACALEGLNFIGIEREAEYVEIAKRRIAEVAPLFVGAHSSVSEIGHMKLYCSVCHTRWEEAVLSPGDKCPFKDCAGHISSVMPTSPSKPSKPSFPLLEDIR